MFKGRKPSRTIELNIRGGEKLPCPLGVLRGTKDAGACPQIKNISNAVTFDYKYNSIFLSSLLSLCLFVSRDRTRVPCTELPLANRRLQGTCPNRLQLSLTPLTPPESRGRRCKPLPALQLLHFKGMGIAWVYLHQQFKTTRKLWQRRYVNLFPCDPSVEGQEGGANSWRVRRTPKQDPSAPMSQSSEGSTLT